MMVWRLRAVMLLGLCAAGPAPADPDWPCVQRMVPKVTASTLWSGYEAAGDWRDDARVAAVVRAAAPRSVSVQAAVAAVDAFIPTVAVPERAAVLPLVFAGLVDETNAQRAQIFERLRGITRRQRLLTATTSRITGELRALPPDAPALQRQEIVERRLLLIREYEEIERTVGYACEVPVQMETKLGTLVQTLQRGLSN